MYRLAFTLQLYRPQVTDGLLGVFHRDPKAVAAAREQHKAAIELFVAEQFLFDTQWTAVKVRS